MRILRRLVLLLAVAIGGTATSGNLRGVEPAAPGATSPVGSSPHDFWPLGKLALFIANDASGGEAAWRSDGTAAGTLRLTPACGPHCSIGYYLALGETARLITINVNAGSSPSQLWVTRGTPKTTVKLAELEPVGGYPNGDGWIPEQGLLYVLAAGPRGDTQVWRTDGTPRGTFPVTALPQFSLPPSFVDYQGRVVFSAAGANGAELWESDGTPGGTRPFVNLGQSEPVWLSVANGYLVFINLGRLWRTDGTAAGTVALRTPSNTDFFGPLWSFGNRLLFVGSDGNGFKLWTTDGTNRGTRRLTDRGLEPDGFYGAALGNRFFFSFNDGVHGSALWVTDGTISGTHLFADLCPTPCDSGGYFAFPEQVVGGQLLFIATDAVNGQRLWATDGTVSGTKPLAATCAGICSYVEVVLGEAGGWIVFLGGGTSGTIEIWRTDLAGNAARLTAFDPSFLSLPYFFQGTFIPGLMLFAGEDAVHGVQLWRSDGTRRGTYLLDDLGAF